MLKTLIEQCQSAVRMGQVPKAQQMLERLNSAHIPDELRLPFANLCRRTGLNNLGLRLINPLIQEQRRPHGRCARPEELAEYAVLLQRTGVLEESEKILTSINPVDLPQSLLYRVYVHFNRWEYHASVPLLKNYIGSVGEAYDRLVGSVNLAAALVALGQYTEAKSLLADSQAQARVNGSRRLEGNCHEILAQMSLHEGELSLAKEHLNQAQQILRDENTASELWVRKWSAVVSAFSEKSTRPLLEFRSLAMSFGDWESLRHTDLYILKTKFDPELFCYHMFGSPWLGYREHAQRILSRVIDQSEYILGSDQSPVLDLRDCRWQGRELVPVGGVLHKALDILLRDFYRPISIGNMFAALFPGEFYDVHSSPNRVHQVIFRLRQRLTESALPVEVSQTDNSYRLTVVGDLAIKILYERHTPDPNSELLTTLRGSFGDGRPFKLKEAASVLQVSLAKTRAFCLWAVERGSLDRFGAGSSTTYELRPTSKKIPA